MSDQKLVTWPRTSVVSSKTAKLELSRSGNFVDVCKLKHRLPRPLPQHVDVRKKYYQDATLKLGEFTNFEAFFPTIPINFPAPPGRYV